MVGELGDNRDRYQDPSIAQCEAGTAPVTRQSASTRTVHFRRACIHPLRETLWVFAFCSYAAVRGRKPTTTRRASAARNMRKRFGCWAMCGCASSSRCVVPRSPTTMPCSCRPALVMRRPGSRLPVGDPSSHANWICTTRSNVVRRDRVSPTVVSTTRCPRPQRSRARSGRRPNP